MIDFTKHIGPKMGGALNKLLDDKHSEHLGIKMDTPFTRILVLLILGAAFVGGYRIIFGLGASTNMNDYWPWGLWIAFDVLGGVAMAAGAFMIAGAVYILNMKKFKCIARASILNAFFGYLLAAISITFDVGRSAVIWHPLIMWQINSVMFIVALHLVCYLTTLAMESSPMVFEKLGWQRTLNFLHRIMVGAVMFGVALSLLHQSSLGANYLILPSKLSALWYSKHIPYMFLVSALMMGLSMVSFETILTGKVFNHQVPKNVLEGLAKGIVFFGCIYFAMKLGTVLAGPGAGALFKDGFLGFMWLLEMSIGVVIPVLLLAKKSSRNNTDTIFVASILVILGVLLNRLNVGVFGVSDYANRVGSDYFPSIMEFILTAGMIAFAILGFKICAKYLNLFPDTTH